MPRFTKHEPGTFCYAELISSDLGASGNFYTELFGWSRNDQDMGEFGIYTQFHLDGKAMVPATDIPDVGRTPGPAGFINGRKGSGMKKCDWRSLGLTAAVLAGAMVLITVLSL